MARRNNNKVGTSWQRFTGNGLSASPAYYWNRRGPRVNQTEGSPSADTNKWLIPDFLAPPTPPTPTPGGGGGGGGTSGGGIPADEWETYEEEAQEPAKFTLAVLAEELPLSVYATMLPVKVVERDNLVYFLAPFSGPPDEIFFSYTAPGSERPHVDPGFGQDGSRIERVKDFDPDMVEPHLRSRFALAHEQGTLYAATVDTTGMTGGTITAHFWGTGRCQESGFEEVQIKNRPRQLL